MKIILKKLTRFSNKRYVNVYTFKEREEEEEKKGIRLHKQPSFHLYETYSIQEALLERYTVKCEQNIKSSLHKVIGVTESATTSVTDRHTRFY